MRAPMQRLSCNLNEAGDSMKLVFFCTLYVAFLSSTMAFSTDYFDDEAFQLSLDSFAKNNPRSLESLKYQIDSALTRNSFARPVR